MSPDEPGAPGAAGSVEDAAPLEEPRAREVVAARSRDAGPDPEGKWCRAGQRDWSVPQHLKPRRSLLEPSDWGAGFLSVEERELPSELYAALRERAPQALLRDLHRPVQDFRVELERQEGTERADMNAAVAELRAARAVEPIPTISPTTIAVRAELLRRREMVSTPWQPVLPDDQERKVIALYPVDDEDG